MNTLSPSQHDALDSLLRAIPIGSIFSLASGVGRGKTTVLRRAHEKTGGAFLSVKDFLDLSAKNHPMALEETLYTLLLGALQQNELVYIDEFHLAWISEVVIISIRAPDS